MEVSLVLNKLKNNIFNVAIIFLALLLSYNAIKQQNKEINALLETKATEIKKTGILEEINKLEKRLGEYRDLLKQKDESLLINSINEIASGKGIRLASIKPLPQEEGSEYIIKQPFELVVEADSFHTLGKFISSLENNPDFCIIEQFNILPVREREELSVNLKLAYVVFKN
ncbi:MAG: type 4a pilus biogenesis protein PilO [Candidatus Omnitrophica bacterium]|nr:type 4a pilus biogenesis protein PilO [Candidatus Omnitrophota bacterium]